ncbi:hypothetical protein P3W85_36140 [Cupriavidus basilensis]|uniref:Glucosamine inositolphosphorylceramide transferase 1 N-terminal domain-containing protein n=1 Tax=Cupriavidus basilensis TaxID=68895 RepID=A0ABT6B0C1_9BURK|nr:hypothetical protein [Cupriavidus basilensis]MDF3838321.1 hypothetical protein [Cupriavidus basilensis]
MNDIRDERQASSAASSTAALPAIAIVLASRDPACWEQQLVNRLRGSGLCEPLVWDAASVDGGNGGPPRSGRVGTPPEARMVTAIVDLSGRLDAGSHRYAVEGIWRLCDGRDVVLGDAHHGLETIASGVGARLHLVASKAAAITLIDSAAAYVDPSEDVSLQRLCTFAETLLLAALREIRALGALDPRPAWKARGSRPTSVQRLIWKARGRKNHVLRRLARILLVEQWMLGVVDMTPNEALRSQRLPVRWIGERVSSYYWADPFGVPGRNDELYCEEYDVGRGVGRIVKLKLDGVAVLARPEPVDLGLPGHLSYPYLFRHAGVLYCVAESAQSRRCVLNRQDDNGRWLQVAVPLYETEAADPTIFEHDGYFWLAYTDVSLGAFDNLCLCYASDLLGPWRAHPQNPVKIDHCSARSAGSVVKDGNQLLRVAQVCRSGYGQAIAVNRILHCTPDLYREEVVGIVSPAGDRMNPHGLHTISEWGDRMLVDGKRYGINFAVVGRKIASRMSRIRRSFALSKARAQDKL